MKNKVLTGVAAGMAAAALMAGSAMAEDYKVGIIQFVDDASLNQIEAAIEARLDEETVMLTVNPDMKKVGLLYSQSEDASKQPIADAKAFFEENLSAKKPVIRTGAEILFTRYFYKYQQPTPSEELEARFMELERSVSERVAGLFK